MSDYVTLLGAETVSQAAHSMRSSAETISHAASTMYEATNRLTQILDEHAARIERAVETLVDALNSGVAR